MNWYTPLPTQEIERRPHVIRRTGLTVDYLAAMPNKPTGRPPVWSSEKGAMQREKFIADRYAAFLIEQCRIPATLLSVVPTSCPIREPRLFPKYRVRKSEAGFGVLLELLTVCTIMLILAAAALPSLIAAQRAQQATAAKHRVQNVSDALTQYSICKTNPANSCTMSNAVPTTFVPLVNGGYVFTFTVGDDGHWRYVAVPQQSDSQTFNVGDDFIVRCGSTEANAPPCN